MLKSACLPSRFRMRGFAAAAAAAAAAVAAAASAPVFSRTRD